MRAAAGRHASTANAAFYRVAEKLGVRAMSEDKHSWDRVPNLGRWTSANGSATCEMSSSTSKQRSFDVDFSHGARLLSPFDRLSSEVR